MKKSTKVIASKKFLEEVWTGDPPSTSKLIDLLDELIAGFHETGKIKAPYCELDPPREDWKIIYEQASKRFPDLGLYPVPDPAEGWETAPMTGDAIDDIADITKDLRQVVWYAENHSDEYAEAFFSELYSHWGKHAEELLVFLRFELGS